MISRKRVYWLLIAALYIAIVLIFCIYAEAEIRGEYKIMDGAGCYPLNRKAASIHMLKLYSIILIFTLIFNFTLYLRDALLGKMFLVLPFLILVILSMDVLSIRKSTMEFEHYAWKRERPTEMAIHLSSKVDLAKLGQSEIVQLLGEPDNISPFGKRKCYYYVTWPGGQTNAEYSSIIIKLSICFLEGRDISYSIVCN